MEISAHIGGKLGRNLHLVVEVLKRFCRSRGDLYFLTGRGAAGAPVLGVVTSEGDAFPDADRGRSHLAGQKRCSPARSRRLKHRKKRRPNLVLSVRPDLSEGTASSQEFAR